MKGAVKIPLNGTLGKGKYALVDQWAAEPVLAKKWWRHSRGYAWTFQGHHATPRWKYLHRFICDLAGIQCQEIDHRNGRKLDNRLSNLRPATHAQNVMNRRSTRHGTSRYKGVSIMRGTFRRKPWRVQIGGKGHLGCFATEEAAAQAYNEAAKSAFGPYAKLNRIRTRIAQSGIIDPECLVSPRAPVAQADRAAVS